MIERYTKHGASTRISLEGGRRSVVRSRESGEATQDGDRFLVRALPAAGDLQPPAVEPLERIEGSILEALADPADLERMTLVSGCAAHRIEDAGGTRTWSERNVRLYVSVVDRSEASRCVMQSGSSAADGIGVDDILVVLGALRSRSPHGPFGQTLRVRLMPSVSAAIISEAIHRVDHLPEWLRLVQSTHPEYPFDGSGHRIEPGSIGPPGIWIGPIFRPSYRFAPARFPFHVRLEGPALAREEPAVRALAMVSAVRWSGKAMQVELLCEAAGSVFAASASIESGLSGIEGVGDPEQWIPVNAGIWGCRLDVVARLERPNRAQSWMSTFFDS